MISLVMWFMCKFCPEQNENLHPNICLHTLFLSKVRGSFGEDRKFNHFLSQAAVTTVKSRQEVLLQFKYKNLT